MNQDERSILPYALLYAIVVFTLTFAVGYAVETYHLKRPSFIMFSIIPIGAWAASRFFAKRVGRQFSPREFRRIVLFSFAVQLVHESFGFLIMTEMDIAPAILTGSIIFALGANLGVIFLSYRYVGRRTIAKALNGQGHG